jgi:hypothetical protein
MSTVKFYLPDDDNGKSVFLNTFSSKLPAYAGAAVLNIPAATVTQTQNDAANFAAIINLHEAYKQYVKNITAYKNHMRDGAVNNVAIGTLVAPPALPTFTGTVVGDIFGRLRKLVQTIKNNPNYTETIGDNLGINGAEPPAGGLATAKAELKPAVTQTLQSGHPRLKWKKLGLQGVKIMVDRGTGAFAMLATDTKTYYLDTFALPAVGASAVWKYMFIYIEHDDEVGQWSDVLTVTVTGVPA